MLITLGTFLMIATYSKSVQANARLGVEIDTACHKFLTFRVQRSAKMRISNRMVYDYCTVHQYSAQSFIHLFTLEGNWFTYSDWQIIRKAQHKAFVICSIFTRTGWMNIFAEDMLSKMFPPNEVKRATLTRRNTKSTYVRKSLIWKSIYCAIYLPNFTKLCQLLFELSWVTITDQQEDKKCGLNVNISYVLWYKIFKEKLDKQCWWGIKKSVQL